MSNTMQSMASSQATPTKTTEDVMMNNVILPNGPHQAPKSKEVSYSAQEYGSNPQIRQFKPNAESMVDEQSEETKENHIDTILNKMGNAQDADENEENKSMEKIAEDASHEFMEEFKPNDFTEKNKQIEAMDDDLMAAFCDSSDSSNEEGSDIETDDDENEEEEEEESDQNESVRIINSDNMQETESDEEESEVVDECDKKEKPMLVQSDSRMVQSDGMYCHCLYSITQKSKVFFLQIHSMSLWFCILNRTFVG